MKHVKSLLLIAIFLTTMFSVPSALFINSFNGDTNMMSFDGDLESQALISQLSHNARVAIYDEDNLTVPAISHASNLSNNLTEITTLLEDAGNTVDLLTEEDILDHELQTANYDVFVIVDNIPRPSIFNHIKEFSLGGGGLLTFDSAMSYLWFGGYIHEDLTYDVGYSVWWGYWPSDTQNVTSRHSTMTDYHVNDTITLRDNAWATGWEPQLIAGRGDDMIFLMNNASSTDFITAFAIDNTKDGGRIVHLPGDGYNIDSEMESIIIDSVDWLVPRPKGRIAFDLTHQPRIGVDIWDLPYITTWSSIHNFGYFRDLAANHTYTFDKLYPSTTANITADRLAPYDVLVMAWPDINYTSAEGAVIESWVDGGGSLLVLGDRTGLGWPNNYGDTNLNMVLQNFDMSLGTTDILTDATMTPATHVTLESCTGLSIGYRNYLVVLGNATEIWMDGTDCVVAGEEFGQGRAILSSDMNIFDNDYIRDASNTRYALNVLNWLTATDAEILVYSSNWYGLENRDAVLIGLRDMGLSYQSMTTSDYIDDFLDSKEWGLLILNEVNWALTGLELDEIYAYVDDGGVLLMSYYDMDAHPSHPLWSKLGVEWAETISGEPSIYIWDDSHDIFTTPNDHSTSNFTSGSTMFDDGDAVTVSTGYTALAGTTATDTAGKAVIVVSADRTTLFNPFLIDNFETDTDDDTFEDRIELWQNEITYIMTEPSGGVPFTLDTTTLLIIGAAVLVLIIVAVLLRRRGGSKPQPRKRKK
ncbi:MAG: hypothetical protein ACFFEV_01965 [Candidatus Thorarchaeota archaeon]